MLSSLEWRWTPLQILSTEAQYPGLMDALALLAWQEQLIGKQMKGKGNGDHGS